MRTRTITTSASVHIQSCTSGILSTNQHGYLPKRGSDTANLQIINTLETSWDEQTPLYGCSWDMEKAFDSVSKPLILLCWQRLGVPLEIAPATLDLLSGRTSPYPFKVLVLSCRPQGTRSNNYMNDTELLAISSVGKPKKPSPHAAHARLLTLPVD